MLVNLALVGVLVFFFSNASAWFGPRSVFRGEKGIAYEAGMPPMTPSREIPVSYYRFAVLFVLFDVDLAFLIPWILLRRELTLEAMISMTVFIQLIGLTLAVVWRKGGLTCD